MGKLIRKTARGKLLDPIPMGDYKQLRAFTLTRPDNAYFIRDLCTRGVVLTFTTANYARCFVILHMLFNDGPVDLIKQCGIQRKTGALNDTPLDPKAEEKPLAISDKNTAQLFVPYFAYLRMRLRLQETFGSDFLRRKMDNQALTLDTLMKKGSQKSLPPKYVEVVSTLLDMTNTILKVAPCPDVLYNVLSRDLGVLFGLLNDGLITILSVFTNLPLAEAAHGLLIYKSFVALNVTSQTSQYLNMSVPQIDETLTKTMELWLRSEQAKKTVVEMPVSPPGSIAEKDGCAESAAESADFRFAESADYSSSALRFADSSEDLRFAESADYSSAYSSNESTPKFESPTRYADSSRGFVSSSRTTSSSSPSSSSSAFQTAVSSDSVFDSSSKTSQIISTISNRQFQRNPCSAGLQEPTPISLSPPKSEYSVRSSSLRSHRKNNTAISFDFSETNVTQNQSSDADDSVITPFQIVTSKLSDSTITRYLTEESDDTHSTNTTTTASPTFVITSTPPKSPTVEDDLLDCFNDSECEPSPKASLRRMRPPQLNLSRDADYDDNVGIAFLKSASSDSSDWSQIFSPLENESKVSLSFTPSTAPSSPPNSSMGLAMGYPEVANSAGSTYSQKRWKRFFQRG